MKQDETLNAAIHTSLITGVSDRTPEAHPIRKKQPIARLEAFDPNGRCIYKQDLVAVAPNDLIRPVWL